MSLSLKLTNGDEGLNVEAAAASLLSAGVTTAWPLLKKKDDLVALMSVFDVLGDFLPVVGVTLGIFSTDWLEDGVPGRCLSSSAGGGGWA